MKVRSIEIGYVHSSGLYLVNKPPTDPDIRPLFLVFTDYFATQYPIATDGVYYWQYFSRRIQGTKETPLHELYPNSVVPEHYRKDVVAILAAYLNGPTESPVYAIPRTF